MQIQTAAYEDDHHPLVRQRFPFEGKMFISGRKVIKKVGYPPSRVKFSERLFEKLVDPFTLSFNLANCPRACSDCLALTELTRLGEQKGYMKKRSLGLRRLTLQFKMCGSLGVAPLTLSFKNICSDSANKANILTCSSL